MPMPDDEDCIINDIANGGCLCGAVRFEAAGSGTRVTIVHRGWDSLPDGHEARHGLEGAAFSSLIGVWWGDLALSLRSHAARR